MTALLPHLCLTLEDIQRYLLESPNWRLSEDLVEKATDAIKIEPSVLPEQLQKYNSVHRIALLSAAAAFLSQKEKGSSVALSIVNLVNALEKPKFVQPTDGSFKGTIFDITYPDTLNDETFSKFLHETFDGLKLNDAENHLLNQPYVTAATVLLTTALGERLLDYSAIVLSLNAEVSDSATIPTDQYTRENSPVHLSKAAQKVNDIVTNSKLIKKKGGSDNLIQVVDAIAPLLGTISTIRTNIAKSLHFFSKFMLQSHQTNLIQGYSLIMELLSGTVPELKLQDVTISFITAIYQKYNQVKEVIGQKQSKLPKGRQLPFGLITKDFNEKVSQNGFSYLTQLNVFKAPQGKSVAVKEAYGARDLMPLQMKIREQVISLVTSVFKRHGAVSIDTPVFELREVLTEKYGEEAKLIYNLEDQGGELLSLRYDLTVPFARFVATHGINQIKRYHIAKVYRRDRPAFERGRFREFYQCDFDIAGPSGPMIADSEVISTIYELLTAIGNLCKFDFEIKISHRQLLSAMTKLANVPPEKFHTVCSSIDKLDKEEWSTVRNELVTQKGLSEESADKLWEYLQINGSADEVISKLRSKPEFLTVASKIIDEMELLFTYLTAMKVLDKCTFNLSLARGLDYYTGVIFEAVAKEEGVKVGSISGGGRYDELIGMFSKKKIPAVGASLGIERIFSIMEQKMEKKPRQVDTQVFVCSLACNYTKERLEIASLLWKEGIPTEFAYKEKPDIKAQLGQADTVGAKIAIILAPDEMEKGQIKIKVLETKEEIIIPKDEIVPKVKELLK